MVQARLASRCVVAVLLCAGCGAATQPVEEQADAGVQEDAAPVDTAPLRAVVPTRTVATGAMSTARAGHTATLLPSGQVLIVGGERIYDRAMLASVELYDPAAGAFTPLAALPSARSNHTATLMDDGRVLVVGGGKANAIGAPAGLEVTADALLYDAATGVAEPVGALATARHFHQAVTLPGGDVLIVGGAGGESRVLPAQGAGNPQPFGNELASCERFELASRSFRPAAALAEARYTFTAVALQDGRVLVSGGASYAGDVAHSLATNELYDPTLDAFTATGSFAGSDRLFHGAATLADGRVLVFGGKKSNVRFLADAELYDPAAGTFTAAGDLPPARTLPRVLAAQDGSALVIGGYTCGFSCAASKTVSRWSPAGVATGPELLEGRANHTTTVLLDGAILVAGGFDAWETASAELLLP